MTFTVRDNRQDASRLMLMRPRGPEFNRMFPFGTTTGNTPRSSAVMGIPYHYSNRKLMWNPLHGICKTYNSYIVFTHHVFSLGQELVNQRTGSCQVQPGYAARTHQRADMRKNIFMYIFMNVTGLQSATHDDDWQTLLRML